MAENNEINHKLGINARKIVENGRGILAIDESESSIGKRFEKNNIMNTPENRRRFRQLFITCHNINDKVGGMILHEETFTQKADNGKLFVDILIERGISPGIKLDKGLIDFNSSEKVSVGLEDLEKRLKNKAFSKAEFAKWRSVFSITKNSPTEDAIHENCSVLARYAEICQKHGIVPIVEPEILWEGEHSINETRQIAKTILSCLMYHLNMNDIFIPGILIKPAFVTPGKDSKEELDPKEVSLITFGCLIDTIPVGVPAIVFLSGGHTAENATLFLDAINKEKGRRTWALTFSYGRALSSKVMENWAGKDENTQTAQQIFKEELTEMFKATQGKYL